MKYTLILLWSVASAVLAAFIYWGCWNAIHTPTIACTPSRTPGNGIPENESLLGMVICWQSGRRHSHIVGIDSGS